MSPSAQWVTCAGVRPMWVPCTPVSGLGFGHLHCYTQRKLKHHSLRVVGRKVGLFFISPRGACRTPRKSHPPFLSTCTLSSAEVPEKSPEGRAEEFTQEKSRRESRSQGMWRWATKLRLSYEGLRVRTCTCCMWVSHWSGRCRNWVFSCPSEKVPMLVT